VTDGAAGIGLPVGLETPASRGLPARDPALDALRGVAIALVVFHHVGLRFPDAVRDPVGRFLVGVGWGGVDLFFAISGFLITRILLDASAHAGLRAFFVKRAFRILPIYLVALATFVAASLVFGNDLEVLPRLWVNLLLLTAWAIPFVGENGVPFTITWSVSVEEFAYLLLGGLSLAGPRALRASLGWLVLAALAVRFAMVVPLRFAPESVYYFAPGRIDAIAMGGLAAVHAGALRRLASLGPLWPALATTALLGVMAAIGRHSPLVAVPGYSLMARAAAWRVAAIAYRQPVRPSPPTRALASVGLVSYFIYLFHEFVVAAMQRVLPAGAGLDVWTLSALALAATYLPARLSWRWLEKPLIRRGHRIAAHSGTVSP
jgi:peptidoglycan/LPS O-acetylase OafA/YrhL